MRKIFNGRLKTSTEIKDDTGFFRGHPDFELDDIPGDVKSLLLDDYMPWDHHVAPRIFYQLQAYMLFAGKTKGLLIFESMESGRILALSFLSNEKIQNNIRARIEAMKKILLEKGFDLY